MLAEPMTLYKLMNLYMLHQVNFPLTNAQLSNFFLDREYTTYFTLQQALNELLDAGLVKRRRCGTAPAMRSLRRGEETLEFFGKNISPAIVSDMDEYLKQNRFRMRNEVGLISDFYKSTNQDYIVHCEVREGKAVLVNLDISVPDKEQAEIMCNHWKDRSQEIYAYVMKSLMSEHGVEKKKDDKKSHTRRKRESSA
ncbi:MAG: DUF4364 family protein [Clostridium fessum]